MDPSIKKNSYELLSMSSSDSDTPQQIQEVDFKTKRKKLRKRLPTGRLRKYEDVHSEKCCHSYGKIMSLSFIIIILCCWLLILSWLIVVFNDELKRFDNNLMAIVAGNRGIPESLQKCHAETKELQRNQSDLFTQFTNLSAQITNLTAKVSSVSDELQRIRDKVTTFSSSADVSDNLKELSKDILSVHGWIDELNNTVTQLKTSEIHLEQDFQVLRLNLTSLKEKLSPFEKVPNKINNLSLTSMAEDMNDVSKLLTLVDSLNANVTYLNKSLTSEVQLLKQNSLQNSNMINDIKKLLNQNVSIRLDNMEEQFWQMSNVVYNLSYQIDGVSNIKLKPLNDRTKVVPNATKPTVPVTSVGPK